MPGPFPETLLYSCISMEPSSASTKEPRALMHRRTVQVCSLRLYWPGSGTRANLRGGQGDAHATMVERARGCHARWTGGRDIGRGGGRTVSPPAQHTRGCPEGP